MSTKSDDAVVDALSVLLASSFTLYLKTHNYQQQFGVHRVEHHQ